MTWRDQVRAFVKFSPSRHIKIRDLVVTFGWQLAYSCIEAAWYVLLERFLAASRRLLLEQDDSLTEADRLGARMSQTSLRICDVRARAFCEAENLSESRVVATTSSYCNYTMSASLACPCSSAANNVLCVALATCTVNTSARHYNCQQLITHTRSAQFLLPFKVIETILSLAD